ncbi:MAG: DUF1329 domain-containing protein, partial [Deltaproteobacteria bacterium]|nr:DUF1329 domain-containing protein [Deltaproteobacteria bacterium]
PLGAEQAGNREGTIPAWTGGHTTPIPGFKNGGRRPDPFANEKPLFSITAKNMDQYADKLTDGTKALLKKYPNTYRLDVYATRRTAAAPEWVYENTYKNALRARMAGDVPAGAYGGIPFPIPKSGAEVMWNHLLRWRGESWQWDMQSFLITAAGQRVMTVDAVGDYAMPYYFRDGSPEKWKSGEYVMVRLINAGPPIRAGESILQRSHLDENKTEAWVYLTGQRRVRKLPNACCDTPTPAAAGVAGFDDLEGWYGRIDRFDWKLAGKKEMYVPYNGNKLFQPKNIDQVFNERHLSPDYFRWELHRVWVVEATLRGGSRHQAPKSRYYVDEDTWTVLLGDRWDASGRLWKSVWQQTFVMPDLPGTVAGGTPFGFYDLLSGVSYTGNLYNVKNQQYKIMSRYNDSVFTPEAMAGEGVR